MAASPWRRKWFLPMPPALPARSSPPGSGAMVAHLHLRSSAAMGTTD